MFLSTDFDKYFLGFWVLFAKHSIRVDREREIYDNDRRSSQLSRERVLDFIRAQKRMGGELLGDMLCGERLGRENRMHSKTKMGAHYGGEIAECPGKL